MSNITKIISGGQTGADMGGLSAGRCLGIETGGHAPKGYRTENGSNAELKKIYGLLEDDSPEYPPRTKKNVANSDATIIFDRQGLIGGGGDSRGTQLTIRYCKELNKPYLLNPKSDLAIVRFLSDNDVSVLNVAGNRESISPGIEENVERLLVLAINLYNIP